MSKFYLYNKDWKNINDFLQHEEDTPENETKAIIAQLFQNPQLISDLTKHPEKFKSPIYSCLKNFFSDLNLITIVSWNVNGIRSRILDKDDASTCKVDKTKVIEKSSNLGKLIQKTDPEIICFQETKCGEMFHDCFKPSQYPFRYWNSSKRQDVPSRGGRRYSGTAIWSKIKPEKVIYDLPTLPSPDREGRIIIAEFKKFTLINTYSPNSGTNEKYRVGTWEKALQKYLSQLTKKKRKVIWCGDLNVARNEMDVHFSNPESSTYKPRIIEGKDLVAGYLPKERESLDKILKNGYIDVYRELYPNRENSFSWWDPKRKNNIFRVKNKGWRIDYFILSKNLASEVIDSKIWKDIGLATKPQGSDHAPISLTININ